MELKASTSEVGRALDAVRSFSEKAGLSEDLLFDLCLCVDEALANTIIHGYKRDGKGAIQLEVLAEGERLTLEIRDHAAPFNPLEAPPPELDLRPEERKPGGLGIFLMRSAAHEINYCREGEWNRLTLKWHLGEDSRARGSGPNEPSRRKP